MADSKYADLPGIAHDEPDVYETTDLPESEQAADFYEDENESIERIHISSDEAFNKFRGKYLTQQNVDFSDKISRSIRTGYGAITGDWELSGKGEKETPLQKYQRLQCEMKELLDEINALQTQNSEKVDVLVSGVQVQEALKKLADLRLEESLGSEVVSSIVDPQGSQIKKLLVQLDQFKTIANEKPESQIESDGSGITYQLNYRPEHTKLAHTSRVAELEGRIHHLESILGGSNEKLARLSAATSKGSLCESAQHLAAIASLLDSSQLDHVEGRLAALSQKLDSISEQRKQIANDEDKDQMILELYELVKKSEHSMNILPQTIERLKSLEGLHEKAADLVKTLTQVENVQAEITGNVENNKILLQAVQDSFANNLNQINQTITSLDNRIKALKLKK